MPTNWKNDEQEDERLNPVTTARNLNDREENALDDSADDSKNGTDESSTDNDPTKSARESERNPRRPIPNALNYTGSGKGSKLKTASGKFLILKKKGPMALIIAALLGGSFGLTTILTPGLAVIQIKEVLTEDLNDQLGAADVRSMYVMRSKIKGLKANVGVCTGTINIRCKFSSLSDSRVRKLKAAGFDIVPDEKTGITGRVIPKEMKFTDSTGKVITIDDPGHLYRLTASNAEVRGGMRRAYNPIYESMKDAAVKKIFSKLGIHKRQKIPDTPDETEARKSIADTSKGTSSTADGRISSEDTDEADKQNQFAEDKSGRINEAVDSAKSSGLKSVGAGAVRGIGILGVADTACVVKSTSRAVEVGAKVARAYQLAKYAMIFLTMADAMKAGHDVTPNQAETAGNIITATDNREYLTIESPGIDASSSKEDRKNPYYQKNALDSLGYKLAAYNEAPTHNMLSTQFMIGGTGLLGSLSSINDKLDEVVKSDDTCDFVTNPVVRVLGGITGIVLGLSSGGTTLVASIAASTALSLALPYLEAMLIDILAGQIVDENTDGPEAGDAIFAGAAFMLGQVAQSRGMQPMSLDNSSTRSYFALNRETLNSNIAYETELAKSDPFNVNNQYSFLGMLVRDLYPSYSKLNSSAASGLNSIASLFSTATSKLSPISSADTFNEERYKVCNDSDYSNLGVDADSFCNVRYIMTDEELKIDTDENLDWMIDQKQIDEITGDPVGGSDYEKFMKNCVTRFDETKQTIVPFGVPLGDDGQSNITDGSECIDRPVTTTANTTPTMANISRFRVYTFDRSIQQSIDEEEPVLGTSSSDTVEEAEYIEVSGDWAAPMTKGSYTITSGWRTEERPSHNGVDLAAPMDTPIYAAADGVVTFVGNKSWGTYYVTIDHGGGIVTEYGHSYPDQVLVSKGDTVKAGQLIARVGNQGDTTKSIYGKPTRENGYGAHLHFNYFVNGKDYDPVVKMEEHGITL